MSATNFGQITRFIPTHVGNAQGKVSRVVVNHGSSPRTWGTLAVYRSPRHVFRFIPTHVGNARCERFALPRFAVHPHARGERMQSRVSDYYGAGSSPRTWGTRLADDGRTDAGRFIPTHVGNAATVLMLMGSGPVHPHARGERATADREGACGAGSSPRTWGTLLFHAPDHRERRFIPTHVGNAPAVLKPNSSMCGSSPRTWGTRHAHLRDQREVRFIPTHVGNARAPPRARPVSSVHPHARGEREPADDGEITHFGSSPRTWGTHFLPHDADTEIRFIPTHVGNASTTRFSRPSISVHPHARGERTIHILLISNPFFRLRFSTNFST